MNECHKYQMSVTKRNIQTQYGSLGQAWAGKVRRYGNLNVAIAQAGGVMSPGSQRPRPPPAPPPRRPLTLGDRRRCDICPTFLRGDPGQVSGGGRWNPPYKSIMEVAYSGRLPVSAERDLLGRSRPEPHGLSTIRVTTTDCRESSDGSVRRLTDD